MMKFPKEIRQFLWSNFETKEKVRDKLFEERCAQKRMCDRLMNTELSEIGASDFTLLNDQCKVKLVRNLKSKEGPKQIVNENDAWNDYIANIKNETRMKNIWKLVKNKNQTSYFL